MKIRKRCVVWLAALLVIGGIAPTATIWYTRHQERNEQGTELVRFLQDTNHRDRALYDLLERNSYYHGSYYDGKQHPPETVKVNHVVVCPQKSGSPLYAVFKAEGYEKYFGGGPGKPLGHVILFDSNGKYLPWYINANSIHGEFEDVNGDGIVENVESIHEESDGGKTNDRLWVLPIVPGGRPILEVRYDPKRWSYRALKKGQGIPWEIWFIQKNKSTIASDSTVIYRWSKEKKAYEGPTGCERIGYWRTIDSNF
jgi:hypothetical protein